MFKLLARFWKDQSGATAIEYGLIAAGIRGVEASLERRAICPAAKREKC
jgi:Flp/Fap pilin component